MAQNVVLKAVSEEGIVVWQQPRPLQLLFSAVLAPPPRMERHPAMVALSTSDISAMAPRERNSVAFGVLGPNLV